MSKRVEGRRRGNKNGKSTQTSVPARRPTPPIDDSVNDRLARLLDSPQLAQIVPRLAPEVLHDLIRDRGLEACATFIAASTPQQLASVLDLDLWHRTPGRDDQFDEQRFGSWLEVLMNEGEGVAAHVVAMMDQSVAITGLSRYVRVFDPGVFQPTAPSDDDLPDFDIASAGTLECDIGGYTVRARTANTWDAIVGLLVTLAQDRPATFHALMSGCRRLSNSTPEIDGLDALLLEPEQVLHDVAVAREYRRTQQGYLTAGDARAFLQLARQPHSAGRKPSSSINAIAAGYFRALDDDVASATQTERRGETTRVSSTDLERSDSIRSVDELLAQAGMASPRHRGLLGPAPVDVARVTPIEPLMEYVHDADHVAYFARNRELAFLANALLAGCSVYSRAMTVQEAWDAAVGICNLGLEVWPDADGNKPRASDLTTTRPDTFLMDHDLVTAFEAGWRLVHEDVSMFVITRLISTLRQLQSVDSSVQRDLYDLRRELEIHRRSGTPWRAGEALEVIAILDTPAWACLCGLLSECPVVPQMLTAIVDGGARSVSATAFTCFTTRGQIRSVHEFAARLRDILIN